MSRGYSVWENDLCSDRWEYYGDDGKLVGAVDRIDGELLYFVENAKGLQIHTGITKLEDAKSIVQKMGAK